MAKAQYKDERYDVEMHFAFGENWADYAQHVCGADIARAEEGLLRLLDREELAGKSFLDIGCGSGLHTLAALRLGAREALAVDIDPRSAETAQNVLHKFASGQNYQVRVCNILQAPTLILPPMGGGEGGGFDIVYSWGVLHHTGALWEALVCAARAVKPGGLFVIALYKKTPCCGLWRIEKRLYSRLPKMLRLPIDWIYAAAYLGAVLISGKNPLAYVRHYPQERGMRFMTDIRDWLGGYPYECASPEEVRTNIEALGFRLEKSFNTQPMKLGGLLGSGCAEYVFRKI